MSRARLLLSAAITVLLVIGPLPAAASAAGGQTGAAARFRVLVFSGGASHDAAAAGLARIQQLGQAHDFEVVAADDPAVFADDTLGDVDAVVFNNTGAADDLLDGDQRAAFERFINGGGGFVGIHAAAASEPGWDWYGGLVGARTADHGDGAAGPGRVEVLDRAHPSTRALPQLWQHDERWYAFSDRAASVHVLAQVEVGDGAPGLDAGEHPFSWCQVYDGGRSWYTAGGHAPSAFEAGVFSDHLLGGIEWAAGAVAGDCGATVDDSFAKTLLTDDLADPFELEVTPDGKVIYIQRTGQFKMIDQDTLEVTTIGDLELGLSTARHSDGLTGFALDPDFADNGWLYAMWSDPEVHRYNLSRFTFDGEALDMDSEQRLLEIPTYRDVGLANVHMGGSVQFGPDGNLYIAQGDNTDFSQSNNYAPIDERPGRGPWDAQSTAANTNDLRGKILRITPTDDGSYTIPEGNLFPEEDDVDDKTRPEIYAMGFRNPFRMTVDPHTGAVLVGDYGPDATQADPARGPAGMVEWNVITAAGNYGWPHCVANNVPYRDYDFATGESGELFDCDGGPVNDSPHNTGLQQLPPVQEAFIWYGYGPSAEFPELGSGGAAPMSGPVYDYDPELDSDTKFPEHYDGKWFIYEYTRNFFKTVTFAEEDATFEDVDPVSAGDLVSIDPFLDSMTFRQPFEAEFGPDGSLYTIDFGSGSGIGRGDRNEGAGIYRIDYVGGDRPPQVQASGTPTSGQLPLEVTFSSEGTTHPSGLAMSYHWDFGDGSESTEPNPTHTYTEAGSYTALLTVTDETGRSSLAAVRIAAGNTAPEVAFTWPPSGGFYDWGDRIAYQVEVTDAEDGSTADGSIDCEEVVVGTLLGHDQHAHPLDNAPGCEAVVPTLTDGGHSLDVNLFTLFEARYTDAGAPGVDPLTAGAVVRLNPKRMEAEHFAEAEGVQVYKREQASAGARIGDVTDGDHLVFDPVNLTGIDAVTLGASSGGLGGTIELRRDAPDGELLGSVDVPVTGSYDSVVELTTDVVDPGETFALYVVFRNDDWSAGGPDLLALDWLRFEGDGVRDLSGPQVQVEASPQSGPAPLEVTFAGSATSPEGLDITGYDWAFGDGGTADTAEAVHTYTAPGQYLAVLSATDADGAVGSAAVPITVTEAVDEPPPPPACPSDGSDPFDGDALDTQRWSAIVRHDPEGYRLEDGRLLLPTAHGDLTGAQSSVPNMILQPAPDGAWQAETTVTLDTDTAYQQAGLLLYAGDDDFAKAVLMARPDGSRRMSFFTVADGAERNAAADYTALPADFPTTFQLRLTSDGSEVTAAYSADGETWTPLGRPFDLASGDGWDVGVVAMAGGGGDTSIPVIDAAFDGFTLSDGSRSDEFDGDALALCRWSSIVRHDPDGYRVEDGQLVLPTAHGELTGARADAPNVILQPAPDGAWQATTQLTLDTDTAYQQAGLVLYGGDDDFAKAVLMARPDGSRRMSFFTVADGAERNAAADYTALPADFPTTFQLRLTSDGEQVTAAYSADGETWTDLGRPFDLASADDWHMGLVALSGGDGDPSIPVIDAAFDWFRWTDDVDSGPDPEPCTPVTPPEGYTALWDGATFDGWQHVGNGSFTITDDCTLMSQGSGGLLWYADQSFGDFHLRLQYRMNNTADNSGVFLRFPAPLDWEGPWSARPDDSVRGYEAQVHDDPGGGDPQKTGSIYNFATITEVLANPIGEWNTYEITAVGQTYTVTLNGEVVNTYTGDGSRALEGHIGLQNHHVGSDVEFRDIWLRELDEQPQPPTASASVDPAEPDGQDGWYVSPVTVTVTSDDPGADLEVDLSDGWTAYEGPLQLTDGSHTVRYRASNPAGTSEVGELGVRVDTTGPELDVDVDGDGSAAVTLTASADDGAGSGVAAVHWRVAGDDDHQVLDGPLVLTEPGTHALQLRAVDVAGNAGAWQDVTVTVVDDEPPACPEPDPRATVVIGDVDSGVPNRVGADGCTIDDRIDDEAAWPSLGHFLQHVNDVARQLLAEGLIDARERGLLTRAAARSGIGGRR